VHRSFSKLRNLGRAGLGAQARAMNPAELLRQWRVVKRLAGEMFTAGGVAIESPADQPSGSPVDARTIIQPDGDVVHLLGARCLRDESIRRAHLDKVAGWYATSASAVGSVRSAWRAAVAFVSGALGLLLGLFSMQVWGGLVGVVALVAVPMGASLSLRSLLPRVLRKVVGPGLI
jgi:hypothetical protein